MNRFSTARLTLTLAATLALALPALAQEPVDQEAIQFIRTEATERSRLMELALWMTDVNGPRLTQSPQLDAAQRWAAETFRSWGLEARLEPWGTMGRGWQIDRFGAMARVEGPQVAAQTFPLFSVPKAWSPGTGRVSAPLVVVDLEDEDGVAAVRDRLAGAVVLLASSQPVLPGFEPLAVRRTPEQLLELANSARPRPAGAPQFSAEAIARQRAAQVRRNELFQARPIAVLEASPIGGSGSVRVMGAQPTVPEGAPLGGRPAPWAENAQTVPQIVVLTEQALRLQRLAAAGQRVTIDLDFEATFFPPAPEENVIAEIRGTDPALADQVVILGGHFDSWHGGTGATDNAAGSAVVMEAARLLKAYYDHRGQGPRRTIRFALWSGEEQGLFGSVGYVNQHYAEGAGFGQPPVALRPDHARVSAYYNLDNGSGRIRGVYAQSNEAVVPIFRAWLDALGDETARTITLQNTGGTDHLAFDGVGIPGFQFIQDPLAYFGRTWHGSLDTYDHLVAEDLIQAATVMAVFAHHTAERDALMPRKPFQLQARN
ncbi:MAG: M28 family peptidase [Rubricoccaceae bacterium]